MSGIAAFKHDEFVRNRERVEAFFRQNPFAYQRDCAAELGLSIETVSRHVKALRVAYSKVKSKRKGKRA